jgi:hypothetical protein
MLHEADRGRLRDRLRDDARKNVDDTLIAARGVDTGIHVLELLQRTIFQPTLGSAGFGAARNEAASAMDR